MAIAMKPLFELCDLIAQSPEQFSGKLAWICGRCPSSESLFSASPRVSRSQLNDLLAVARFVSKCPDHRDHRAKVVVLDFLQSLPASFNQSFWPQSFEYVSIASFYEDLLGYVCEATDLSSDFGMEVAGLMGDITMAALSGDLRISRAFLSALSQDLPPILPSDANKLVSCLLDRFEIYMPTSPRDLVSVTTEAASSHSSPHSSNYYQPKASTSPVNEVSNASGSSSSSVSRVVEDATSASSQHLSISGGSTESKTTGIGFKDRRRAVSSFEEESSESLEKEEIAFKLIGRILDKAHIDPKLLEQLLIISKEQLHSMVTFLKTRKQDWTEQGSSPKARISAKLSVYQAAARMQVRVLVSLDSDGKSSKMLFHGTLALLIEAAEACFLSAWRKLRICEELFSSLLGGVSQLAVTRGSQVLRRLKPLVLTICAKGVIVGSCRGAMFESVLKTICQIIEFGWSNDRASLETFVTGLATRICEQNDYEQVDEKEKEAVPIVQLNLIQLLADLSVSLKKAEVVDILLPLFIGRLEGDASTPSLLRLRLLDAVSRMASSGFEKSYREAVVLMTRSYLNKLSSVGSAESRTLAPEATTERVEILPTGFLHIASGLTNTKLRSDFRYRLLSLCSDVGLAAESKTGSSGADFLGPLLPAVAEICSDIEPTVVVEPSLLKLFRNLWFYVALFGLAPPLQKSQSPKKLVSTSLNSVGSTGLIALQAVGGPYLWNTLWLSAVQRISQGTPPLVVSSVKWLEDELELNALHNSGSRRGSGNDKAALAQRTALSAALGGRVEVSAMSTISGVKATYLLAVAFLEMTRFSSNGGILNCSSDSTSSRSAFSCVFEYLKSPSLMPAVFQCLTAIVHRAFETLLSWLEDRKSETRNVGEIRESTLSVHACFLIKSMSHREECIRDTSVSLLTQLRERFPQILWNTSCLDSLLFSVPNEPPHALVNNRTWAATIRSLYQRIVLEWITTSLSYAPCTSQGLLQEKLCKANTRQRAQPRTDVVSLLSEVRIGTGKSHSCTGTNIPAVMAAAAAASGANFKSTEPFNLEVLSTGIVSASVKCKHAGVIAGMRLYENIECIDGGDCDTMLTSTPPIKDTFDDILLAKFVRLLQKFVYDSEKGGKLDKSSFHETCSQATALLLSNVDSGSKSNVKSFSQLLRLLCWCPAYICMPDAMEIGVFIWTWLVSAAPQLGSSILAELVDAWLWTTDTKRGLFASEVRYSGPAAKLRPHLEPGAPQLPPEKDPVDQILAHRLWLGFFIDRFEVVRHDSIEQLLLLGRMLKGSIKKPWNFSRHPAAVGTFCTLMLLGLKFCSCQPQSHLESSRTELQLLEDCIYRASLGWFAHKPEWYDTNNANYAQSEAQSVSVFVHLLNERINAPQLDSSGRVRENGSFSVYMKDEYHPLWGHLENYNVGREKRKQLLLMLCQHEAERLDVWAQPLGLKESTSRPKISSEKWVEYARSAFSVDPKIALSLAARFPTNPTLKAAVTQLVQSHILEIRSIPEALPYFVTPKTVAENSALLQQLPHWAPCSITQALEFLTPAFKGHPRVMAYVLRVLESYPPDRVTFFMPQLVQALRYDEERMVEGYLLRATQRSDIFAHILIWHLQGETCAPELGKEKDTSSGKSSSFQALLPVVRQRIIDSFTPKALDLFKREFEFFDKVTCISGVLFPLPKEERRAGIRRELLKIEVKGEDLYLPTAPNKLVRGIQIDSGIPLQSAAKVPIMITFNVVDRDGDPNYIKSQACIFKVGDDCRQDVLALQVISLLKDIFEAAGLKLYLFPYGVLPTGPERGIIEVVQNTRSRSQMGETTDGGLYEIFQQDYGPVGSPSFEAARENFIISSAGYAVASLLLQPKDRHNGNLLFDSKGRLVHIDFGFILETSPGGNMRFESAHFKLSHEMTQLLDPSGVMKSDTWYLFVSLCVKGYLAARCHMDAVINTVLMMVDSGLPCFSRGEAIANLRKRFHPEMSEREAANFMIRTCADAYNKWTTAGYDLIQYLQQGIEK